MERRCSTNGQQVQHGWASGAALMNSEVLLIGSRNMEGMQGQTRNWSAPIVMLHE